MSYFIAPSVSILMGILTFSIPSIEINSFFGFRTKISSVNQVTFDYCNKLCGKLLIVLGAVFSVIMCFMGGLYDKFIIGLSKGEFVNVIFILFLILLIPVINLLCKKKFPQFYN